MTTVCAWCERESGRRAPGLPVSHGICRSHARQMLALVGLELARTGEDEWEVPVRAEGSRQARGAAAVVVDVPAEPVEEVGGA